MNVTAIHQNVTALVQRWSDERAENLQRRHLNPVDFKAQGEAGLKLAGVRKELGGVWCGTHSTAPSGIIIPRPATVFGLRLWAVSHIEEKRSDTRSFFHCPKNFEHLPSHLILSPVN